MPSTRGSSVRKLYLDLVTVFNVFKADRSLDIPPTTETGPAGLISPGALMGVGLKKRHRARPGGQ
jgi:hypothetical protein